MTILGTYHICSGRSQKQVTQFHLTESAPSLLLIHFWELRVQTNRISIALADSNSISPETAGEGMFILRWLHIIPEMNKITGLQNMLEINKIIGLHENRPLLQVSSQTSLWNQVKNSCFPNCEHQYTFSLFFFLTIQNPWKLI